MSQVPALGAECVLKAEGLEPNQKYVFALAAYNSQGSIVGSTVGATTLPLLASMPLSPLSTWAHLAQVHHTRKHRCAFSRHLAFLPLFLPQVAFQTEQFALAKRACRALWSHFTYPDHGCQNNEDKLAATTG